MLAALEAFDVPDRGRRPGETPGLLERASRRQNLRSGYV
jgi:hypothetical protein